HRINPASFDQICASMTEAEVEAILGVPWGDYAGAVGWDLPDDPPGNDPRLLGVVWLTYRAPAMMDPSEHDLAGYAWHSDDWTICVVFCDGLACQKRLLKVVPCDSGTLLERIRNRLGL